MDRTEIEHLNATILRPSHQNRIDPVWVKAFKEFNASGKTSYPLGMGCPPCYSKVLTYFNEGTVTNKELKSAKRPWG